MKNLPSTLCQNCVCVLNHLCSIYLCELHVSVVINLVFMYFIDHDHLKCFVNICKSIAEGHAVRNALSNLYEVGMKFSILIYNLPESTGFNDFFSKCKSLLETLKQQSNLTIMMVKLIVIICVWKLFSLCHG